MPKIKPIDRKSNRSISMTNNTWRRLDSFVRRNKIQFSSRVVEFAVNKYLEEKEQENGQ